MQWPAAPAGTLLLAVSSDEIVIQDGDKSVHPMTTEMPKGWTSTRRAPASMSEGRLIECDRVLSMTLWNDAPGKVYGRKVESV
jgi:hypothetical protein